MSLEQTNAAFEPDEACEKRISLSKQMKYGFDLDDMKKPKQIEEDYDPYLNRKVEHPTTNSETLFHLLKGSLGTGILAMPKAFYHSGYILGVVGTVIIGFICTYCIHILVSSAHKLCKRRKIPSMSYPYTAVVAFEEGPPMFKAISPYFGHVVNTFLLIYQIGTCAVYTVFISENVESVVNFYVRPKIEVEYFMLMFLLPLILISWIRNLKLLAPLSTAANVITFVGFGIILYYLIDGNPTFDDREAVGQLEHMPLFFGTVLFALEAIGVILPLENEMKTPKSFGTPFGVLNIGMVTIIALYVGMGFLGYLTYGAEVDGVITLTLPKEEILVQVLKVLLALAIYVTYALQCYVAIDITWNQYLSVRLEKNKHKTFWEFLVRTIIVIITFSLAIVVPKIDLFISLFGALGLAALGISIPALIDMCTHWYFRQGISFYLHLVKGIALVVFGILGLVVGTYTSLEKIIEEF